MDATLWARIREAFSFVVSHEPEDASDALLQACGGDDELVLNVRPLVEEHFRILEATTRPASETSNVDLPSILAGRYRVLARLGGGTFGDVYRVSDEAGDGGDLALKILRSSDPVALFYFKREFRSLADIYHRNIIKLRELIVHQDRWMFTMEFVDGVNLVRFLDDQLPANRDAALRSCLLQLAEGLVFLHRSGLLHRDVKPSNVLVTSAGRVVLLDFGLVRPLDRDSQSFLTFAGTPDYMSPELASGAATAEPSDWYAFGVLLYRILTRRLPFQGGFVEVLRRKQVELPVPPVDLVPDVPAQLNTLCLSLLERNPSKRASYEDVVGSLQPGVSIPVPEPRRQQIVGRSEPLQRLTDATAAAEDRPALIHLCGPSGIGKTALLREFATRLSADPSVLVFAGRCFESEAVPYQALDDLIDHIGQYFRRLPGDHVERLLPRNFAILVKMFPVLAPFLSSETKSVSNINSTELRTRALAALRELLGRLRERHRIVLVVDDLQWGDLDGCMALKDLFSSGDSPAISAVLAYRSEDIASSASLQSLRDNARQTSNLTTTFIDLGHLDNAECGQLAESLLTQPVEQETLQRIAEQSGGNPFFIQEIARWINARGVSPVLAGPFSLGAVVRSRVDELSVESRRLLELVAVAGQPTELSILKLAGGMADPLSTRDDLVSNRLLRSRIVRDQEEVEIYHDRIRATILAEIDAESLTRRHSELASALESAGAHDPERIAGHYEQAQNRHLCAKYALIAAERASEVLAFNEASRFFEMALDTNSLESDARRIAHRQCGDALAKAGHGHRAAGHYISACQGATVDEQLEWNLRAAEELLYSGHVEQGLEIFSAVLKRVGIRAPTETRLLGLDLLIRRACLRIRGLGWRERPAHEVPRSVLLKIDTCSSVATGLALVDVLRGAALQTTSLILALRAGEPSRIARALAMEAGYRSTGGQKTANSVADLLYRARELSNRTGDPRAIGITNVMMAGCAWTAGRWQTCYRLASEAREGLRERREFATWERDTTSIFEVDSLRWMGRWSKMKEILPELIEDARNRGDLYAGSILQMEGGSCADLANDDPARALAGLKILERWSKTGFHVDRLVETHNEVEIALYAGETKHALDIITKRWPMLEESFLLQVQNFNIQMRSLRARAALAAAWAETSEAARRSLLKLAERESLAIKREGATWGCATSELIQGSAELLSGRRRHAIASLERAERLFHTSGMLLHRAVARLAWGRLIGRGEIVAEAEAELQAEGIANPERFSAVVAPGQYSLP